MKQFYYIFFQTQFQLQEMSDFQDSQGYTPELNPSQVEGDSNQVYKRRIEKLSKNSIEGKWTEQENTKYILYMDYHYKIFVSKEKRKSERIFKALSKFLTTRTPRQCRSHFQKIMNKFKKLRKVKLYYQEQLGIQRYQRQLQILANQIKGKTIKLQETDVPKCSSMVTEGVQTQPFRVTLADLSNVQLIKLMNLLHEYHKVQIPQLMGNNSASIEQSLQNNFKL